jgi:putative NADH-flavin reductase
MKIALIGASGDVGSRLLAELSARGHDITAIARNTDRIAKLPKVTAVSGDASKPEELAPLLKGHDVAISAIHFTQSDPHKLIEAVKDASVPRYMVVGGAGSLEVGPGQLLVDSDSFPDEYKPEARAGLTFLNTLRDQQDLNWTFISPSAAFLDGERTGQFRLGGDTLLANEQGSSISFQDYAVAFADELETPKHERARFTVGY